MFLYCDGTGHVKSDCQHRAEDMRVRRRPFVDKSNKVSALQATDETPPVASETSLLPDFDGYLFAITVD